MTLDRWLTLLVGFASIAVTWLASRHYYRRADRKPLPTFIVQSRQALAAPGLGAIGLSLLHDGREVGKLGITRLQIYFGNSGTLPIQQSLDPFRIVLTLPILACSVIKATRDVNVIGLQISFTNRMIGEECDAVATLDFSVLEPGDGGTIELIYDGPFHTKVEFKGACIGAPKPLVLPPDDIYSMARFQRWMELYNIVISVFVVPVAFGGAIFGGRWLMVRLFGPYVADAVVVAFITLIGAAALAMLVFVFWYRYKRVNLPYVPPDLKP